MVDVNAPARAVRPAAVGRTPAWCVGPVCQFTAHDILENCCLPLLMLLSNTETPELRFLRDYYPVQQPCSRGDMQDRELV